MESSEQPVFQDHFLPDVPGYSEELVIYHMRIMSQANLLHHEKKSIDTSAGSVKQEITLNYYSISWKGHEFLDDIRDESRWKEVNKIMSKVGGFAVDVVTTVAKEIAVKAAMGHIS